MRLLVITDLYPPIAFGGYERTCAELVDGLRERHEVTVLTSDLRRDAAPAPVGAAGAAPPGPGAARDPARAEGGGASGRRRRALDELRPQLVYVSSCLTVPQAAPWTAVEAGVPIVYRLSELWFASALYRGDRFVGHLLPGQRGVRRAWSWVVRAVNRHPALRLDPTPSRRRHLVVQRRPARRVTLPPTVRPGAGADHPLRHVGRVRQPHLAGRRLSRRSPTRGA